MRSRTFWLGAMAGLVAVLAGCAAGMEGTTGTRSNMLTAEEIADVQAQNLYEVVQRLRPRWLEVRSPRSGFEGGTDNQVVVFLDRTFLGGVDELRGLGKEVAAVMEYMSGSQAAANLPGIHSRNVEGAIVVRSRVQERN